MSDLNGKSPAVSSVSTATLVTSSSEVSSAASSHRRVQFWQSIPRQNQELDGRIGDVVCCSDSQIVPPLYRVAQQAFLCFNWEKDRVSEVA